MVRTALRRVGPAFTWRVSPGAPLSRDRATAESLPIGALVLTANIASPLIVRPKHAPTFTIDDNIGTFGGVQGPRSTIRLAGEMQHSLLET